MRPSRAAERRRTFQGSAGESEVFGFRSSEAPPHLALREERAGAGGLLHADPLGRALELVLAPVRAEEVAALLVLAARHALAALDAHAADGVVRLPRNLLPLARIHRRPPGSPVFGCEIGR